jgi:arginine N-succinyltransferase
MTVIRPVTTLDLDGLLTLASLAGVGLTTLPKDRDLLQKRVKNSIDSFATNADKPGGESYLFVMEDTDTKQVVGACGITSKVGGFQPFYAYKIETALFESKLIHVRKEVPILRLDEQHDGPCEIGSLFLHPDYRRNGNGRMLQLVRFLFIAEHPERFESTVVSEIRGMLDNAGHSPFWDALGKHFFAIDFAQADRLSVVNKKFIAELMPRHPIYIPLLPASAQTVIGKPHRESERAVKNLETEGFKFANMVDIFDAGPVLSCPRDEIRSVKQSRRVNIRGTDFQPVSPTQSKFLLSTTADHFCACHSPIQLDRNGVVIPQGAADALHAQAGEEIRIVELDAA